MTQLYQVNGYRKVAAVTKTSGETVGNIDFK